MALEKTAEPLRMEQISAFGGAVAQRIREQATERPAKPVVRRNIEADFLAAQDCRGQLVFHQLFEKHFLLRATDLQGSRELGGKLDETVIEKWRTHLDGVSHAHAVT